MHWLYMHPTFSLPLNSLLHNQRLFQHGNLIKWPPPLSLLHYLFLYTCQWISFIGKYKTPSVPYEAQNLTTTYNKSFLTSALFTHWIGYFFVVMAVDIVGYLTTSLPLTHKLPGTLVQL